MAKTKSSVRGKQNKKIVVVKPYKKKDGTKVGGHRRSTPDQRYDMEYTSDYVNIPLRRRICYLLFKAFTA